MFMTHTLWLLSIVGHVPRKFSICSIFIRKGGTISCQVSGGRRYSADLPQGGLEIPCVLKFQGKVEDVNKVKKLAALILTPNPNFIKRGVVPGQSL